MTGQHYYCQRGERCVFCEDPGTYGTFAERLAAGNRAAVAVASIPKRADGFPDTPFQAHLARLECCREARAWVDAQDYNHAWYTCTELEWLDYLVWKHALVDLQGYEQGFVRQRLSNWWKGGIERSARGFRATFERPELEGC